MCVCVCIKRFNQIQLNRLVIYILDNVWFPNTTALVRKCLFTGKEIRLLPLFHKYFTVQQYLIGATCYVCNDHPCKTSLAIICRLGLQQKYVFVQLIFLCKCVFAPIFFLSTRSNYSRQASIKPIITSVVEVEECTWLCWVQQHCLEYILSIEMLLDRKMCSSFGV